MAHNGVPLKLRKQMLLMRAAVERVELAEQVLDVRRAATLSAIVRNAMPGDSSRSLAQRGFEFVKHYPFAITAASIVASRFKLPLLMFVTKWGGAATIGYKLWDAWKREHGDPFSRRPTSFVSDRRPRR